MRYQHSLRISAFLLAGAMMFGWSDQAGAQQSQQQSGQSQGPGRQAQERMGQAGQQAQSGASQLGQQAREKMGQAAQQARGMLGGGQMPQGVTPTSAAPDQIQKVHKTVQEAVQSALTKGDFKKVANYFTGRDRDRIANANVSTDELDRNIDQFNTQWKNKYNTDFKISDQDQALKSIQPQVAQVTNPQQLASNWPLGHGSQQASEASELQGREIAILSFPAAQQGQQGETASLVQNESGDWKFDIPNTIDAQTLVSNLAKQISTCTSMSNNWPSDPNQAYALVAGQVVRAFYEAPGAGGQGASAQQSSQQGQQGQQSQQQSQQPSQAGQQPSQQGQQPSQQGQQPQSSMQTPQPGQQSSQSGQQSPQAGR